MHPVSAAVVSMHDVVTSLADMNPTFLSAAEKASTMADLVALEARVAELRLRILAVADDVAHAGADRDAASWLARTQRLRRSDCAADLRLATALDRERTQVARALRQGSVNVEQARIIAAAVAELPARVGEEVREQAEIALVEHAAAFGPAELARLGRRILDVVAPDVAEAEEARRLSHAEAHAAEKQRLRMRALGDGTTRISALVPDATATRLATYLHAFTNPRAADGEVLVEVAVRESGPGQESGAGQQVRSPYPRRMAHAFGQLLESLDPRRLPIHGGDATTLTVTVTLEALRAELGTASLAGGVANGMGGDGFDNVSAAHARRLACTASIIPAVLGADSEVLDLGRSRRLFSPAQRKALLIRDGGCRAEGCDVPGAWCEAHHLVSWQHGGATSLENSALLCSHHHHRVHDPAFTHQRSPDGRIAFRRRRDYALIG